MLTAEQLEARQSGLGGSDTATILGLNPYKSGYELWQEKTGRVQPEDISGKFAIRRGNDMEALVAKWFSEETGMTVRRDNRTITNPDHPYMLGHIDRRIQGKPEGLECKTANWRVAMKFGEAGTDDVPANYLIQCVHYMIVTGWRVWHLAADLGGEFRIFKIDYDEALADHIANEVNSWWVNHIVNDIEPTPTTPREIDLAYSHADKGKVVEASESIVAVHSQLRDANAVLTEAKDRVEGLKSQLKSAMKDADTLTGPDGKKLASWNEQTRRSFNSKAFAKDHPQTFEQYQNESSFRVFRPNLK